MVTTHSPSKNKKAVLFLEDDTFSIGYRFGAPVKISSEIPFHFEPNRNQVTVLTTNGEGMMPYCGVSAITVNQGSANGATLNERRCV